MDIYGEGGYWLVKFLLFKGLALTYLATFTVSLRQYTSLVGQKGVKPIEDISLSDTPRARYSLFYYINDDRFINFCALIGIAVSLLTLTGVTTGSALEAAVTWFTLWLLFLSFVNTGQVFYSYGWETILLETGFLAVFLGGLNSQVSESIIWLFRWILFRMMLGAGLVKLRGDNKWTDLTALKHHFETQPFPNPLSRFYHFLPDKILKSGTLTTHLVLLIIPFLYFLPQPFAAIAGIVTIMYQIMVFSTGNYGWLNLITVVLAFSTFNNAFLSSLPLLKTGVDVTSYSLAGLEPLILAVIIVFSYDPVKNLLFSDQVQNMSYSPLHLVNTYGAFPEIPEERKEVIIEGYEDGTWKEYRFYGKPEAVDESPRQISPYLYRLEYPFWFIAHGYERDPEWLENLLSKLVSGNRKVLRMVKEYPFEEPEKIRARIYKYKFAGKDSDKWWERKPLETIKEIRK